ncbi:hypothetical protein [Candidatus Binatus sp.]|uniref:hypothetical protein n=1 Tax=Candidatus Binatus sp. TaxID=2811406 RepID=UPI002F94B9F2
MRSHVIVIVSPRFDGLACFRSRVEGMGITEVITAPRSPWQKAYVERVIGSIRRE